MNIRARDFDKEAATWDTPPRITLAADISRAILGQLPLTPDMDILDFGCGTGLVSFPLHPLVHSITGVDSSKGMLDILKDKVQKERINNVKALYLDLAQGETISGSYHVIISAMAFHHIKNTQSLLTQLYQILLPGGHIAIADLDEEGGQFHENNEGVFHFGFTRDKLSRLFVGAGFTDISSCTAAHIAKPNAQGQKKVFSVFLITGRK